MSISSVSRMRSVVLLLAFLSFCSVQGFNLTILHTNDIHARFEQFNTYGSQCTDAAAAKKECFGGMARLMTKIEEIREKNPNVILTSAGDFYQGTYMYTVHKWKIVVDFANRLGHDFMCLGNHEFDDGVPGVVPFLDKAKFPFVGCNINTSLVPSMQNKINSSIIRMIGGRKVGITGYTTPETKILSTPGDVIFTDEIEALKKEVQSLKAKGVDIIIAVGHSGYPKDLEIAEKVKGLDVVIGGHTDTFLYTGDPPSIEKPLDKYPVVITHFDGSKTLVVQDYTFAKYLGFLQVQFTNDGKVENWGGNPILLDGTVEEDPLILDALRPYVEVVAEQAQVTVGTTKVLLRGDRNACRMRECNMGNMLTDAAVNHFLKMPHEDGWTEVSIAVWNSGGIRSSFDETLYGGNITVEDMMAVVPFGNIFHIVELCGEDVIKMMEEAVWKYDLSGKNQQGSFLQVSGLKVWYDLNKEPGKRVAKILAKCARCRIPKYLPINSTSTYKIAVPDFIFKGGDGFTVFSDAIHVFTTGELDSDIIQKYLQAHSPIITAVEGRLILNEDELKFYNSQPLTSSSQIVLVFSMCLVLFTRVFK